MRQLTVKYHPDSLENTLMLSMTSDPQCKDIQCGRFDPRMCTVNPWPSLEEWIVPCRVEPLTGTMEASGLDEETDGTILGFVT